MSIGKTEIPGMIKVHEGIVLNTDKDALALYKKRKQKMNKVDELEHEIKEIKNSVEEIKEMLRGIIK